MWHNSRLTSNQKKECLRTLSFKYFSSINVHLPSFPFSLPPRPSFLQKEDYWKFTIPQVGALIVLCFRKRLKGL